MVRRIDETRIGSGEVHEEVPRGSGAAHERLLRGASAAGSADGFVASDVADLPVGFDGAVVSLMESLLNRDHRTSRARSQDAPRLLLFDAMTSDRPYRAAMSREEACAEIAAGAGTQFDPRVAEVFLRRHASQEDESKGDCA